MHAVNRKDLPQPGRRILTLGDAIALISNDWLNLPPEVRAEEPIDEYSARTAAYAIGAVLDCKDNWAKIPLSQLFGLEQILREYAIREGFKPHAAGYYTCQIRKIMAYASSRGWSCWRLEVMKSWGETIAAFTGQTRGCLQIIEYLISRKKTPATTTEKDLQRWVETEGNSLEITTTEEYLSQFRGRLRAAGLEPSFPHLDLRSKRRRHYGDSLKDMTPGVRAQLKRITKRKTAEWMADRSAREIMRPVSVSKIYSSFRRLHGYRTRIREKEAVASLVDLVTPDNVLPFIDFLANEIGLRRQAIYDTLAPIMSVVRHDPLFEGSDYEWIPEHIRKVPKERRYKLFLRKEDKAEPYERLGAIPKALRLESEYPDLSAEEVAWLRHDEVLISLLYELVFRQRNIRECRTFDALKPNLKWKPLNNKLLLDLYIPKCVLQAYNDNNLREFLMICFDETETKSRRAETVVLPLALASLIEDFNLNHRGVIIENFINRNRIRRSRDPKIKEYIDHGHLFLNRRGGALSQDSLRWQVRRLTRKYIGHKVSPHIWRDIFAAYTKMLAALGLGGGRKMLQRRLFQVDDQTTDGYSQLGYALPGIAALDSEYQAA